MNFQGQPAIQEPYSTYGERGEIEAPRIEGPFIEKDKDLTLPIEKSPPVVELPQLPPIEVKQKVARSYFKLLNRWEGYIVNVNETEFRAVVKDLTNRDMPDEDLIMDLEEVSDSDRDLVKPGAVFYWSIGYETSPRGQKSRKSYIQFRRIPVWTKSELNHVKEEAQDLARFLGSESP